MGLAMEGLVNLNMVGYCNNRELSWLAFNEKVLEEAIDKRNPLLERLQFLSIFSTNLDEFFMDRIAGLKDQVKAWVSKLDNKTGLTPMKQIKVIFNKAHDLVEKQYELYNKELLPALREENIQFLKVSELNKRQKEYLEEYFDEQIFPVLTPFAVDAYHPFPALLNKTLSLAVTLYNDKLEGKLGIVQVPAMLARYIYIPTANEVFQFALLEDVINSYLYKLFTGYIVDSVTAFRITRNADLATHEEGSRDLSKEIEKELKKEKWGTVVRLEVTKQMDKKVLGYLLNELEINESDIYLVDGPLDLTLFFNFYEDMRQVKEYLACESLIPQSLRDLQSDEDIRVMAQ